MTCEHDWFDITVVGDTQTTIICLECGERKFMPFGTELYETSEASDKTAGDDTQATKA
ncbi:MULTISPECIES: hypothetical protein [Acinetobacter]|uniref:hypothetical protein n=1 Tax=Acinetobacter TaxID=469 RepID=UPI00148CC7D3|nr:MULTISPECIES: hypothetical protein [Acinetobacter]MBI1450342.1 hypothetical protein [Acinetobacter sp. FL51]